MTNRIIPFYANYLPERPAVRLVEVDDTPRSTGEIVTATTERGHTVKVVLRGERRVARPAEGKRYFEFRPR